MCGSRAFHLGMSVLWRRLSYAESLNTCPDASGNGSPASHLDPHRKYITPHPTPTPISGSLTLTIQFNDPSSICHSCSALGYRDSQYGWRGYRALPTQRILSTNVRDTNLNHIGNSWYRNPTSQYILRILWANSQVPESGPTTLTKAHCNSAAPSVSFAISESLQRLLSGQWRRNAA